MSKVDALRALREARFAAQAKTTPPAKVSPPTQAPPTAAPRTQAARTQAAGSQAPPPVRRTPVPSADPEPQPELCGHRNMSGRTCTRPAQHAEKNHRYG